MRGGGGVAGYQPISTAVHITWHGANLGELSQNLTYWFIPWRTGSLLSCVQVQGIFVPLPIISRRTLSIFLCLSISTLFNSLALVKSVMATSPFIFLCDKFPRGTAYFYFKSATRQLTVYTKHYTCLQFLLDRSRIHEHTVSLKFLGIILRVLRLEVSVLNVYTTNYFQTIFAQRGRRG
jgi:hypothetical protein